MEKYKKKVYTIQLALVDPFYYSLHCFAFMAIDFSLFLLYVLIKLYVGSFFFDGIRISNNINSTEA